MNKKVMFESAIIIAAFAVGLTILYFIVRKSPQQTLNEHLHQSIPALDANLQAMKKMGDDGDMSRYLLQCRLMIENYLKEQEFEQPKIKDVSNPGVFLNKRLRLALADMERVTESEFLNQLKIVISQIVSDKTFDIIQTRFRKKQLAKN